MLWCEGEKEFSMRELLATAEGRQKFADWLLRMRDVEERAISALAKAAEAEE